MRDRLPVVLSITALVVAVLGVTPLGEAAYEAVVPDNSVGERQLKNGAVTAAKLRGDAVTGAKVRNNSLRAADFAVGQLPAGPPGPQGTKGDQGANGANGANAATNVVVRSAYLPTGSGQVSCQPGERATGGGITGANITMVISKNEPIPNTGTPTGWVGVIRAGSQAGLGTVYVVCASP